MNEFLLVMIPFYLIKKLPHLKGTLHPAEVLN